MRVIVKKRLAGGGSSSNASQMMLKCRREEARGLEPPKITKRPSAQNVAAAAASLPSRGRAAPERPPENNRPSQLCGPDREVADMQNLTLVESGPGVTRRANSKSRPNTLA